MSSADDLSATQFGRYILHRKLADGGMAEIFLAEQRGVTERDQPA